MHHSPPQMLNSYLIKGERPSLSPCVFYEPRSQYIANQSESAKDTVGPNIGKNIEMLVCLICMRTKDGTLIDINHHYQITMNQHKNWINIKSNIFIVSAAYLFTSLHHISFQTKTLQKKSFYPRTVCDYFLIHLAGG